MGVSLWRAALGFRARPTRQESDANPRITEEFNRGGDEWHTDQQKPDHDSAPKRQLCV